MCLNFKDKNLRCTRIRAVCYFARVIDKDKRKQILYGSCQIVCLLLMLYILQKNVIPNVLQLIFTPVFAISTRESQNDRYNNIGIESKHNLNDKETLAGEQKDIELSDVSTDACDAGNYLEEKHCNINVTNKQTKDRVLQKLEDWIGLLKRAELGALGTSSNQSFNHTSSKSESAPILSIVSCNSEDSIWKYKYVGSKGKKRIFHGKGKLSFTKSQSPPHGYDYGMKSGHCLKMAPEFKDVVDSIDGIFDERGILNGDNIHITYRNGKVLKVTMMDGVIWGLVLEHEKKIDPETNREAKDSPVLSKLSIYKDGKEETNGYVWNFLQNGVKLLSQKENNETSFVFLPNQITEVKVKEVVEDKSNIDDAINDDADHILYGDILNGRLDLKDEIVLNARKVTPVDSHLNEGLMIIDMEKEEDVNEVVDDHGNKLKDYDLQTNSWTNAVTAKLFRFFNIVTNSKEALADHFQPLPSDTNHANGDKQIILKFVNQTSHGNEDVFTYLDIVCPYDKKEKITAKLRKNELNSDNKLSGPNDIELKMVTDWRRKDIQPYNYTSTNNSNVDSGELGEQHNVTNEQHFDDDSSQNELLTYKEIPISYSSPTTVESISARFDNWSIVDETVAKIKFTDGSAIEGFVLNNAFHGVVRYLDSPLAQNKKPRRYSKDGKVDSTRTHFMAGLSEDGPTVEVSQVTLHKDGYPNGPSWQFLTGAFLYIDFSRRGEESHYSTTHFGAHISHDLNRSYVGMFEADKVVSGQLATVIGQVEVEQIRVPQFSAHQSDTIYRAIDFSRSNSEILIEDNITSPCLIADPVEDIWVYVNTSQSVKHMYSKTEEGVFAKIDIPSDKIVAFYGGFRYNKYEWNEINLFDPIYWRPVYIEGK